MTKATKTFLTDAAESTTDTVTKAMAAAVAIVFDIDGAVSETLLTIATDTATKAMAAEALLAVATVSKIVIKAMAEALLAIATVTDIEFDFVASEATLAVATMT